MRGIRSEVEIGPDEGLPEACVISCDNLITLPKATLSEPPIGHLGLETRAKLDRALRYALDVQY
jgi:mRNA interferase MazF